MAKTFDDKKIIYTMDRVSKSHGTKQVLKDISLSYFYGAKIGVLGLNGSGKSSLLKILAGVDTDFVGETSVAPGYSIGFLQQEPHLEPGKTVKEVVSEGVKEVTDLLAEFDAINEAFGDPDADMDKLLDRQAKVQEKLDACNAWDLDSQLELAMGGYFDLLIDEGDDWIEYHGPAGRSKYVKALESSITYIAYHENLVCGYARCREDDGFGVYVYDLLVRKTHRGRQIGKSLMERVCQDFPDQPVYVMSDVDPYYEKLGYRREGSIFEVKAK